MCKKEALYSCQITKMISGSFESRFLLGVHLEHKQTYIQSQGLKPCAIVEVHMYSSLQLETDPILSLRDFQPPT